MEFEVLKRSRLKRNIIIGVIVVAVISAIVLQFTKAKYRVAQSLPLINGTVNYSLADLNVVAVYLQDESATDGYAKSDTIPTSGYTFNDSMSYCTVGGVKDDGINLSYNADTQSLSVSPMTTAGTKCYLYFDEQPSIKDTLLAYYPTVLTRTDFSTTVTDTTTGTIYKSADSTQHDDDGEVYYFAGNPTDNWVSFAGFYWRIIRVNGDGSVRLIYQGTSANTTGTGTQIGTSAFNSSHTDNMHVGYMYTSGSVHGLGTSSTIKGALDSWYLTNIQNKGYSSYIDTNVGFCGDRSPSTSSSSNNGLGGTGTTITYYGANIRQYSGTPTFGCTNNSDLYTTSSNNKGNEALTYPIGLITMDEVWYAGGYTSQNRNFYLYTGQSYWTISPFCFSGSYAFEYMVSTTGYLMGDGCVTNTLGIRPVINLKADTDISEGNGSSDTPFVVVTS